MAMLQLAAFARVYETGDNEFSQFIHERVSLGQRHSHYEQSTFSVFWYRAQPEIGSGVCFLVHVNAALMAVVQRNGMSIVEPCSYHAREIKKLHTRAIMAVPLDKTWHYQFASVLPTRMEMIWTVQPARSAPSIKELINRTVADTPVYYPWLFGQRRSPGEVSKNHDPVRDWLENTSQQCFKTLSVHDREQQDGARGTDAFFLKNWIREWELTVNPNDSYEAVHKRNIFIVDKENNERALYIRVIVVLQGYIKTRQLNIPDLGGMGRMWESVPAGRIEWWTTLAITKATRELDQRDMSPAEEEWRQLMEYFAHDDCSRLVVLTTTGSYE
ncbi:hypothetical protein BO83DRAFT_393275 [Aspergillus eucalypticola CBS 122712]|uniref:Uncharacterized protein n=1 Tax=Aspergillus eucalypticola (strain CBS 122712 / IBT 29274) TaxID=1448314 RepID=A0A317UTV1_ASPEC|nr:uncharacterized protein BO83DRAFT_393275 [Aspergillus eucalypticola CBS 122712]PWY63460.1 hypothetical protein BO83DRAFT_393275 [Aspergillus eucalypticola CBS 122712]